MTIQNSTRMKKLINSRNNFLGNLGYDRKQRKNVSYESVATNLNKKFTGTKLLEKINEYKIIIGKIEIENKKNSIKCNENEVNFDENKIDSNEDEKNHNAKNVHIAENDHNTINNNSDVNEEMKLQDAHNTMRKRYYILNEKYDTLNKNHCDLNENYCDLNKIYTTLNKKYKNLNRDHDDLKKRYDDLNKNYNYMNNYYINLNNDNNNLNKEFPNNCKYFEKEPNNKKWFGHFCCKKCDNKWQSAHSYYAYYQQCKKCKNDIYPFILQELEKGNSDGDKQHEQDLCGKCKELGYSCILLKKNIRKQKLNRSYI